MRPDSHRIRNDSTEVREVDGLLQDVPLCIGDVEAPLVLFRPYAREDHRSLALKEARDPRPTLKVGHPRGPSRHMTTYLADSRRREKDAANCIDNVHPPK